MASFKNATVAAFVAALIVLAAGAPLRMKRRTERPSNEAELLNHLVGGLDVLYQVSVLEFVQTLNLSSEVNASNIGNKTELNYALNITCDLYSAQKNLIPSISNSNTSTVVEVVKTLNEANLNNSCEWLSSIVEIESNGSASVKCTQQKMEEICKRWESIRRFKTTKGTIKNYFKPPRFDAADIDTINATTWVTSHFNHTQEQNILNMLV